MVILHKLLQANKYLFADGWGSEKEIEDEREERSATFLQIFIYFQLLSMFCRCKGRRAPISVLPIAPPTSSRLGFVSMCVKASDANIVILSRLLWLLSPHFLRSFNEIPLFNSSNSNLHSKASRFFRPRKLLL
jgi:hypothetical protein